MPFILWFKRALRGLKLKLLKVSYRCDQPETPESPEPARDHMCREIGVYKNTEHHSYTNMTFIEIMRSLRGHRQPAPFARCEPGVPGWTIEEDSDAQSVDECLKNICKKSAICPPHKKEETDSDDGDQC